MTGRAARIESLEARTLLAGSPLGVGEAAYLGGTQLRLQGTPAADAITVTRTADGLLVTNTGGWSSVFTASYKSVRIDAGAGNDTITFDPAVDIDAILYGGTGNDTLTGGAGEDRLYGGQGTNALLGGDGNDILVSIGGGLDDTLTGNAGRDSYWTDATSKELITDVSVEESAAGAVHRVGSFYGGSNEAEAVATTAVSAFVPDVEGRERRTPESILEARLARAAAKAARAEARATLRAAKLAARAAAKAARLEAKAAFRAARSAMLGENLSEPAPGPMDLVGQDLADPALAAGHAAGVSYEKFSDRPLFAEAGPSPDDVAQGAVGDCYYLAVLSSIAKIDPERIRESVVDLGDGTYCVQFHRGGNSVFVRVDSELAKYSGSSFSAPVYAQLGAEESMWVAVMEKAYAFFRSGAGSYESIISGWMNETYSALGAFGASTYDAASAGALLHLINKELQAGKSVTFGVATPAEKTGLVGYHAYSVDAVVTSSNGVPTHLRLRNPWGFDGFETFDGASDGYVTVTAQQAFTSFLGFTSAAV